jgi:histone chaperone ASF1
MIPAKDLVGVTVVLITCSYVGKEFVRVGYYVNNEYADEALREDPPTKPVLDQVHRNILAEKPRVTRFPINWDNPTTDPMEDELRKRQREEENTLMRQSIIDSK